MKPESPIPLDLTGLGHADFAAEILPLLEALVAAPEEKAARRVRAVVLNRALILLRTASRSEIDDESYALYRFLDSPQGEALREKAPEAFGGLDAVARLLDGASERADRAAVDSILRNHGERGKQVLEAVAAHGEAMPRRLLRDNLGMSESHLSHVLRELEEARLIVRYRPGKGKKVVVDLAPMGREVVETSLLPRWIQHLVDRLRDITHSRAKDLEPKELAVELQRHGAPSRTAAVLLATAVEGISRVLLPEASEEAENRTRLRRPVTEIKVVRAGAQRYTILDDGLDLAEIEGIGSEDVAPPESAGLTKELREV